MISQDIKKKHPNSLRCHKGLALRLLGKIVDNADELINQLEATLSSEDTRGVRAFWSANQQLMIGIEREGTDDWLFLSLLP
ncbi:hypothetical protein GUITHDRAFT_153989 [Guillardia theta CCMP2712]|nr:hypothetical protein GUITHDRAFT_156021 [Guillardia theta CCMP2712]XP_005827742.1 hypothetical protein GUITHDRAFT_153989 [Guillardia theta CCMP2712]EKX33471.1 hypothetical protein GUITHDRAFT_156021 [Guillardia theta CCMP2712]EKX40762.1 hypothetical protein GUITHDRAFT_153989 [Guillardia theta CCMP2712]|eukprot:XP_005820451.1 hypothetical protein GUITHDRAFT_156021 [Guillardia theta CCMP2712]